MPVWTWVALGVFVGLTVPAALLALVATIKVFRRLYRLGQALEPAGEELALRTDRLAEGTEAAALSLARLEESVRALRASREQLGVLLWAFEDVRRLVRIARSVVPKK